MESNPSPNLNPNPQPEENPSPPPKKVHGNTGKKYPHVSKRYKEFPIRAGKSTNENLMALPPKSRSAGSQHYSDQEKVSALLALAKNNYYIKKTSLETGIPEPTLTAWKRGKWVSESVREKAGLKVKRYRDRIEEGMHKALTRVINQLDETEPKDSLSILAEFFKQYRTLHDQPNTITSIQTQGDNISDEFWQRLTQIARKYEESLSQDDEGGPGGIQQITLDVTAEASVGTVPEQPPGTSLQQHSE